MGTFHNLNTGNKCYVNSDTLEVLQHLFDGGTIESFFPHDIPIDIRSTLLSRTLETIKDLEESGVITSVVGHEEGKVKNVNTLPPLRVVFIETTKQCNLRCGHCYVPDCSVGLKTISQNTQLTNEDIFGIVEQLDSMGVMEVQLTGGEFFILPHALEVIQDLQSRLVPCSIFTNATIIGKDAMDHFSRNHDGLIFYVSLDGFEKSHNFLRGTKNAFQKTVSTIRQLMAFGCDVRINTAISRQNLSEMRGFMDYVRTEFGVLHRLIAVDPIGRADSSMTISAEEFSILLKSGDGNLEFLDSHDSVGDWLTPACGVGSSMLFVDAYGNVSFCPTLTQNENPAFLAGNIHRSSIKDIWEQSPVFTELRGVQCNEIADCASREVCKGGCRSKTYLSTGKLNLPDKTMCALYKGA